MHCCSIELKTNQILMLFRSIQFCFQLLIISSQLWLHVAILWPKKTYISLPSNFLDIAIVSNNMYYVYTIEKLFYLGSMWSVHSRPSRRMWSTLSRPRILMWTSAASPGPTRRARTPRSPSASSISNRLTRKVSRNSSTFIKLTSKCSATQLLIIWPEDSIKWISNI